MVFPFTAGPSVGVLGTVCVPGWGGPFTFITFCLSLVVPSLTFISRHSLPDLFSSCPLVHSFLSLLALLLTSSSSFSPFLSVFLHIFLLPLPLSLPQRSHGSPVVCLLEGIPTPPPPPLEPRSFFTPARSLFLSLSLSLYLFLFFSSSLFNVEVLSNCWLLLWFGGNGIFQRMPHAMASIHSRVSPPSCTHALTHQHRWILEMGFGTCTHKSGL